MTGVKVVLTGVLTGVYDRGVFLSPKDFSLLTVPTQKISYDRGIVKSLKRCPENSR